MFGAKLCLLLVGSVVGGVVGGTVAYFVGNKTLAFDFASHQNQFLCAIDISQNSAGRTQDAELSTPSVFDNFRDITRIIHRVSISCSVGDMIFHSMCKM